MALISCYECGTQVSTDAAACPKCGAPNKNSNQISEKQPARTRPIFKVLAVLLAGFILIVLLSKPDSQSRVTSDAESSTAVTAEDLAAAYKANEVSADNKYKGKRLLVSGTVDSINKDFKNSIWVGLATDNQFLPIHAEGFVPQQVSEWRKGNKIEITCIGAGMVVGSPLLKECT
jgi:uncharacterized membrane protein YvbJ